MLNQQKKSNLFLFLLSMILFLGVCTTARGTELRLFYSNDVHGELAPCG